MKTTVCEICKKATEDNLLTVGEHEAVCWDCATKMALDAKAEGREIEIEHDNGNYIENCRLCNWCDELFPESELCEEVDLGHLCDRCIAAIHSRGESLTMKY